MKAPAMFHKNTSDLTTGETIGYATLVSALCTAVPLLVLQGFSTVWTWKARKNAE